MNGNGEHELNIKLYVENIPSRLGNPISLLPKSRISRTM